MILAALRTNDDVVARAVRAGAPVTRTMHQKEGPYSYFEEVPRHLFGNDFDCNDRVEGWADIVGVAKLTDPDDLAKIDGKFIWTGDYAASRLQWKKRDPLWVLALRAHRLAEPVEVPFHEKYGGCTSWVDLAGLPADPASVPSEPALSDGAFEARLGFAANDLPAGFETPTVQA